MKCHLLRYNKKPLELNVSDIARITGVSQSNVIVVMKTGEEHMGYMVTPIDNITDWFRESIYYFIYHIYLIITFIINNLNYHNYGKEGNY